MKRCADHLLASNMARIALALILAFGLFGISHGFDFRSSNEYVSKWYKKIASLVDKEEASTVDSMGPISCKKDGLFPNPGDCSSYVKCKNEIYYILPCANDQHFNPETSRCEDQCSARCQESLECECGWDSCVYSTTPTDFPAAPTEKVTNEGSDEFTESSRKSSPWKKRVHQFTCSEDGLYPYPHVCTKYVQCSNGVSYIMPCPEGLHFSERSRRCESPCDAECDDSLADMCRWNSKTSHSLRHPLYDYTCIRDGMFSYPLDCSKYIQCSNGYAYTMDCPQALHFNEMTKRCEYPCDAHCDHSIGEQCGWDETSTLSATTGDVCNLPYFKGPCNLYIFRYYWDSSIRRCKKFIWSGCKSNGNNFETSEECMRICGAWPYASKKSVSSFTCVSDGLYPNPDDCATYIQCSNGQDYVMPCPRNLHFNPETQRCESPCDARCDPSIAAECGWGSKTTHYKAPQELIEDSWISSTALTVGTTEESWGYSNSKSSQDRTENAWNYDDTTYDDNTYTSEISRYSNKIATHYKAPQELIEDSWIYSTALPVGTTEESWGYSNSKSSQDRTENSWNYDDTTYSGITYTSEESRYSNKIGSKVYTDCESQPDSGPCNSNVQRYYYHSESGRCRSFNYGGCRGNGNNFRTRDECEEKCQKKLIGDFKCPSYNGKFAHYSDCLSYYQCKRGIPILKRCPMFKAFDVDKSKCVPEDVVVCALNPLRQD